MNTLPNELVEYILDYLGRKSLVHCLLINHLWNAIANYLMKKVRLEFGFCKIVKPFTPYIINIAENYTFYTSSNSDYAIKINKYNLLTGKYDTLISNFNYKSEIMDINNKHIIYDDSYLDEHIIHLTNYELFDQLKDLYTIKHYKSNIMEDYFTKIADDNLYIVQNNYVDIQFCHRKISGEKIKKLYLPFDDLIMQIMCSDKTCFLLGWNLKSKIVIHINLLDYSYKRFKYPLVDFNTIDNEGRYITYVDNIINIYEQGKLVNILTAERKVEITKLIAYNRILYLEYMHGYIVYYY